MFNGFLSDGTVTIPLQAAHLLRAQLVESSKPIPPDANKANSFTNPAGREPGRGWIVCNRTDLGRINLNGLLTLTLTFGGVSVPLYNLVITREPMNLSASNTSNDPKSAYLVELADSRWRVCNPNFVQSISSLYNVPSTTPTAYLASSRNSGVDWTWATMVADLWLPMSVQLGTFPGLPFTPNGSPVAWIFQGGAAWDALCDVLDRLGCTIRANLSATANQYSIVQVGAADTANDLLIAAAIVAKRKIHDGEFRGIQRGKFPANVRVLFHKQLSTPTSIPPFLMNESLYPVDVAGGIVGAEAGVYHPIIDDLPALVDGSATVTNTVALAARALERATDFYRMGLEGGTRFWQRFSNLLSLTPGSKIKSVTYNSNGSGVYTDVFGHPVVPDAGETMSKRDYAGAGTVQDLVRLGFPQVAVPPYHFALSTSDFTAATADAPGFGFLEYYTADFQPTGLSGIGFNACGVIPAGWWLDVHREPFKQWDMVTPRCERVTDSDSDSSASATPCICADTDVLFVIDTTGSMTAAIATVKSTFSLIAASLSSATCKFGVLSFKDVVSSAYLYQLDQAITGVSADVQAALNGLTTSGGGDGPEAHLNALEYVAAHWVALGGSADFARKRAVFLISDAPAHTCVDGPSWPCTLDVEEALGAACIHVYAFDYGTMNSTPAIIDVAEYTNGQFIDNAETFDSSVLADAMCAILADIDACSGVSDSGLSSDSGDCECALPPCLLLSAVGTIDCACISTPITCVLTTDDGFLWTGTLIATGCPGSPSAAVRLQCSLGNWSLAIGPTGQTMTVNSCSPLNMTATLLGWATSCANSDSRVEVTITEIACDSGGGSDGSGSGGGGNDCLHPIVLNAGEIVSEDFASGEVRWYIIPVSAMTGYAFQMLTNTPTPGSMDIYSGPCESLVDEALNIVDACVDHANAGPDGLWYMKITGPVGDSNMTFGYDVGSCP